MYRYVVLGVLFLAICGCGQKADQADSSLQQKVENAVDQEILRAASTRIIKQFGKSLKQELVSAMSDGGPVNAIAVCSEKAPEIAKTYSVEDWHIKRVSDKYRNPDNMADDHEKNILMKFATADTLNYYDEFILVDSVRRYNYYQPIRVNQLCLKCHGDGAALDSKVKAKLQELYPDDNAVGYAENDLRGMFVVSTIVPGGLDYAKKLIDQQNAEDSN